MSHSRLRQIDVTLHALALERIVILAEMMLSRLVGKPADFHGFVIAQRDKAQRQLDNLQLRH